MGYLDELKKMIGESFEAAGSKDKASIDAFAKMSSMLDEAEKEHTKLMEANAELAKSYKELVLHPSIKATEAPVAEITGSVADGEVPNFADYIRAEQNKSK